MAAPILTDLKTLELDLELALQTHRALFETLHAEVRQASVDCDRVRAQLTRRRGPVRGGTHYLSRPASERVTTLPLHRLVG